MTMTETLTASLARLPVTFRDIEAAAGVLAGSVERTRFDRSRTLSNITGANIWLKHWSEINSEYGGNPDVGKNIGIYFAFGIGGAFLVVLQTLILWLLCSIEVLIKLESAKPHRQLTLNIRLQESCMKTSPLAQHMTIRPAAIRPMGRKAAPAG